MKTARLVFVSTPYSSIECKDRDRNYYAKQMAQQACAIVRANGYEPISPVLAWMDVYSELERERVMKNCEELLRVCSYYYSHPCKWSERVQAWHKRRRVLKNTVLVSLNLVCSSDGA